LSAPADCGPSGLAWAPKVASAPRGAGAGRLAGNPVQSLPRAWFNGLGHLISWLFGMLAAHAQQNHRNLQACKHQNLQKIRLTFGDL
jgi:hypothetical protein